MKIEVKGLEPEARRQPKIGTKGGKMHFYKCDEDRDYQKSLAMLVRQQYHGEPFGEPIQVDVVIGKDMNPANLKYGDADNHFKQIGDALRGVLWIDDRYIVSQSCLKTWSAEPFTRIEIKKVDLVIDCKSPRGAYDC